LFQQLHRKVTITTLVTVNRVMVIRYIQNRSQWNF